MYISMSITLCWSKGLVQEISSLQQTFTSSHENYLSDKMNHKRNKHLLCSQKNRMLILDFWRKKKFKWYWRASDKILERKVVASRSWFKYQQEKIGRKKSFVWCRTHQSRTDILLLKSLFNRCLCWRNVMKECTTQIKIQPRWWKIA